MSTTPKNILHVEDDSDFHTYIDALLSDVANVTSVFTRKEFSEMLTTKSYDLFILDLVLRDGSGYSISKTLKKTYPNTPIVLLSAHDVMTPSDTKGSVADVVEEIDAAFIKGRLDENEFISTVKKLLG